MGFTSHVERQGEALQRALDRHQENSRYKGLWECVKGNLRAPNGNAARWFTAKDKGAVESLHAPFMIRILDEVKSMDDEIITATNRWTPKLSIMISSKGLTRGKFHECFTRNKQDWVTIEADAFECPWISQRWIDQQIRDNGKDSEFCKSAIFNEWSDVGVRNLITYEMLRRLRRDPPIHTHNGEVIVGADPSAAKKGGDEFVLFHRLGNKVMPAHVITGYLSALEAVGESIRFMRQIKAKRVRVDNGGMGILIVPMYSEQLSGDTALEVAPVDFGAAANNPELYADRGTEIWAAMAKMIEERAISLPEDPILDEQLTTREVKVMPDGRLKLVSKEEMRRQGLRSPDRGDALALCLQKVPADTAKSPTKTLELMKRASHRYSVEDDGENTGDLLPSGKNYGGGI